MRLFPRLARMVCGLVLAMLCMMLPGGAPLVVGILLLGHFKEVIPWLRQSSLNDVNPTHAVFENNRIHLVGASNGDSNLYPYQELSLETYAWVFSVSSIVAWMLFFDWNQGQETSNWDVNGMSLVAGFSSALVFGTLLKCILQTMLQNARPTQHSQKASMMRKDTWKFRQWFLSLAVGVGVSLAAMTIWGGPILTGVLCLVWLNYSLAGKKADSYESAGIGTRVVTFFFCTAVFYTCLVMTDGEPHQYPVVINSLSLINGFMFQKMLVGPPLVKFVLARMHKRRNARLCSMLHINPDTMAILRFDWR